MNHHLNYIPATLADIEKSENRTIARMEQLFENQAIILKKQFDNTDSRLDRVEGELKEVSSRLDKVGIRLSVVGVNLEQIDSRLSKVEQKLP